MQHSKSLVTMMLALAITAVSGTAWANCNAISNNDQRYMCKALSERKDHHCNAIREHDLRYSCKAQSGAGSHNCNAVKNSDARAQCKALSGG